MQTIEYYTNAQKISKNTWIETDYCKCNKQVFKYQDVSKNIFVIKCKTPSEEFDLKTKTWNKSKKKNCGFFQVYYGEKPEYGEIVKKNKKNIQKIYYNKNLK